MTFLTCVAIPVDLRSILGHAPESAVQGLSIAAFRGLIALLVAEVTARFPVKNVEFR